MHPLHLPVAVALAVLAAPTTDATARWIPWITRTIDNADKTGKLSPFANVTLTRKK